MSPASDGTGSAILDALGTGLPMLLLQFLLVLALLVAAPLITWRMFTTLAPDERVAWIIWVWGLGVVVRGVKRMRVRPSAAA